MALAWRARWFDWRQALVLVQPVTLIRWYKRTRMVSTDVSGFA
jgi:hypothetical protein